MKSSHPMLNLTLFKDQRFSVASFGMVLIYFAMFGIFFLLTQYFQLVHGYDPLKAGFAGLPFAVVMMATAPQGPKVAARIGLNRTISLGMGMAAVGLLLFSLVGSSTPYLVFVIPMMVMAGGMALSTPSLTASIMSAVPLGRAGVGSAMNDTTRELGGALGVAVLGSLAVSRYDSLIAGAINQLPPVAHSAANSSLSGALEVAGQLPGREGAALANTARDAYVSGMNTATLVAAVAAAIGSVVVYRMLPAVRSNRVAARTVTADTVTVDTVAADTVAADAPAAVTLTPVDAD
jgi:hypothetical protein